MVKLADPINLGIEDHSCPTILVVKRQIGSS